MKKRNEKKENKFVAEQAINFDKLPWNRKERNFALFWPTALWGMFAVSFFMAIFKDVPLNSKLILLVLLVVTFSTPLLYCAYKDYLWALVAIPIIYIVVTIGKYLVTGEFYWMPIIISGFFILPVEIELYRREHGLSKPKNIKKDMIIGISLGLFFPFVWILAQMVR